MAVTIGGNPVNADQAAELRAALGIPEPQDVGDPLSSLLGTDQHIVMRGGEPFTATVSVLVNHIADALELDPPEATAPAAFSAGQWTATAGDEQITVNITALPSDGGSAITALEYRLDGGTAVAFTGTGTGVRNITGLTNDTEYDIEIRAVNAVGNGAWSDLKSRTPVSSSGAVEWISAGSPYATVSSLTAHSIGVPAGMSVGDYLVVVVWEYGTISNITLNNSGSQTLGLLVQGSPNIGSIYGVQLSGSVPTTITVNLSSANDFTAQAFAASGVTGVGATVNNGEGGAPRTSLAYTSTESNSLVIALVTSAGNNSSLINSATFNGSDAADFRAKWEFTPYNVVAGEHSGTTGSQTIAITFDPADSGSGGRHIVAELVA